MPRPRFTLRWLMVAMAAVGAGSAYIRFAIWAYSAFPPNESFDGGTPEPFTIGERATQVARLAAPPILGVVCFVTLKWHRAVAHCTEEIDGFPSG